jgi:hypothetical protein
VRGARYLAVGVGSLDLLAADAGCAIAHPLLDRGVWSSVASHAPRGGFLGRSDAMDAVFGDLLPGRLRSRPDKAGFDEVFFHDHSRAFAAAWDGGGVPQALVDAAALREHWLAGSPRAQSFTLLQAAWLASDGGDGVQEPLARRAEHIPPARAAQSQHGQ